MITKTVAVTISVEVTVDDSKFDEKFMDEFKQHFYSFETLDDHIKHLGQLAAREVYAMSPYNPKEFVEGYGPIGEMGILAKITDQEEEID